MSDDPQNPHPPRLRLPPPPDAQGFNNLLQGRDAWWHFLEAKGRGDLSPALGDDDEVELELEEVGRIAERHQRERQPKFQPHHTQSLRCDQCAAQIPADLTLCVYCGAAPRFGAGARWQLLIIDRVEDPDILDELAALLGASNDQLDPEELLHALGQPPAVFYFSGRDEHAEALVDRLGELGVRATTNRATDPQVSMHRETVESILRSPKLVGAWLALLLSSSALAFVSSAVSAGAILVSTGAFLYYQSKQYRVRYELDVVRVLNALTGLDADLVRVARKGLTSLRDDEARELLTICLMEYYAIWRQLSAADPSVRRLLSDVKDNLDELLIQILDACMRYAELHNYLQANDADELRAAIDELDQRLLTTEDAGARKITRRHLDQRHRQLRTVEDVAATLPPFKERLRAMCSSMESLRARVVSMTLTRSVSQSEEQLVQQIMLDLDDELHVFEQTLAEVSVSG